MLRAQTIKSICFYDISETSIYFRTSEQMQFSVFHDKLHNYNRAISIYTLLVQSSIFMHNLECEMSQWGFYYFLKHLSLLFSTRIHFISKIPSISFNRLTKCYIYSLSDIYSCIHYLLITYKQLLRTLKNKFVSMIILMR